jgi:DNA-binding NarL/FixJ family response regulator
MVGEPLLYYEIMIRVYLASAISTERSALRLMLLDMNMEIAGEANNWSTTLAETPKCHADMLVADWKLLPDASSAALDELRWACPKALVIILISRLGARQQAALSVGADMFISKSEMPERVAEHLRAAAMKTRTQ